MQRDTTDLFSDADTHRTWWRSMAGWFIHKWSASRCVGPNRGTTATHRSLNARAAFVKNWYTRMLHRKGTYNCASSKSQRVKTAQSSSREEFCNQQCAGIVECSCSILKLNRSIKSKWAILGLCRYCIQWATYACTDWRTQKHRRDAASIPAGQTSGTW